MPDDASSQHDQYSQKAQLPSAAHPAHDSYQGKVHTAAFSIGWLNGKRLSTPQLHNDQPRFVARAVALVEPSQQMLPGLQDSLADHRLGL